ncbi:ribosomal rna small subunit methyltransferase a [Phtheirospermum japonicum]|uniref:rRNA adenine N(6)-methyltransferase n=1 Tax=Phtheirospermum japonicum TaxID=374723 RepID=A0A830CFT6_9LAMI|nr:ribosomal rna small subunit methyltransferase a [Phtheirospermum japonicum]
MNSLLHSAPPVLPFPPPAYNSLAATSTGKLPNTPRRILANTTSERKPKGKTDDYHSTLKALNSKGRFPRKSLGQHYMVNGSVNEELIAAGNVKEGDIVLEIGQGTGSLTNMLVNAGASVLAIEKDPYMASLVRERFPDLERVKVVANIPFNISTEVVKQLLPMGDIFSEVILLLQDEAALRLVDSSLKSSEYRPINIFVNFYSDPEYKIKVSRTNFFPQPKVDAAVVAFKLKKTADYPRVSSIKSFFSMVNCAFNEKRKMLRKSLQHVCPAPDIEAALCAIDLPPTSRPEELTLDDFVKLHNLIILTKTKMK